MTTSDAVLDALRWSDNGALTHLAIREQVPGGMRAVAHLERRGLVTVERACSTWIETDGGWERHPVTVVRLTEEGRR